MPYTLAELAAEARLRGFNILAKSLYSAQYRGALELRTYVIRERNGASPTLYADEALDAVIDYLETHHEDQLAKWKQPPEVVEARMRELRERFPDEHYRMEMLIRLLKGDMGRIVERQEDVA